MIKIIVVSIEWVKPVKISAKTLGIYVYKLVRHSFPNRQKSSFITIDDKNNRG